jgi:hypothetical protein
MTLPGAMTTPSALLIAAAGGHNILMINDPKRDEKFRRTNWRRHCCRSGFPA